MTPAHRRVTLMLTTPGWRGSGISFLKIAAGLAHRGHEVRFIAGDAHVAGQLVAAGLPVDLVPTGDTGRREVGAVRQLFAAHAPDVVICDAPRDVRIARYASFPSRRAIVWRYNLHGRRLATDVLQRWLFGGVSHIVHQSRYSAARLQVDSPWLQRRPTSCIANGFDLDRIRPDAQRSEAFRAQHAVRTTLVITPTGAAPEKAVAVAYEAVRRLAALQPVTWAVAADVPPHDDSSLRVLALGSMPTAALHEMVSAADLVLLPAPGELFNNVAAESMALGALVVGANSGATPEVVGDAGVLFRADDPADAVLVMQQLLGDPSRRAVLRVAARQRIAEHYPLEKMQDGFERLVRQLTLP